MFDLLTLKLGLVVAREVGKLHTNFGVSGTSFWSIVMGQHLSDGPRDLLTLTFDLGGHMALAGDTGLRSP